MEDPRPHRRIHAELSRRIEAGELEPGARLHVGLVADEFGVTRTTAGKALKLLESEGRVTFYRGMGWYVKEPPPEGDGS